MEHKNIIWILVDSIRNYRTEHDERGKLEVMEKFGRKAIEFSSAVTSAPSTIMGVSAMMTGVPAIYQSRTFVDFKFDSELISLPFCLEREGYHNYSLLYHPESRIYLKDLMGNLCEDFWPQEIESEFWDIEDMTSMLESLLLGGLKEPFFLYLHFDCRGDYGTSDKIEKTMSQISSRYNLDDSIVVLNSDHGYPDPSRKISFTDRRKYGHDLVMTDDNILTPLYISAPSLKPRVVSQQVSTTGIMPTILELADIKNIEFRGIQKDIPKNNLLNKNYKASNDSMIRIDNRFIFQGENVTAIRSENYKYINDGIKGEEYFFDINKDKLEITNLVGNNLPKKTFDEYRNYYQKSQSEILNYHYNYIFNKLENIEKFRENSVLILGKLSPIFKVFIKIAFSKFDSKSVYFCKQVVPKNLEFNVVLCFITGKNPLVNDKLVKSMNTVSSSSKYYLNYNIDIVPQPSSFYSRILNIMIKKMKGFRNNPLTFFVDLYLYYRLYRLAVIGKK